MQLKKLVYKSSKGDRRAQQKFFDMFSDRLYAVASRYSKTTDQAEDALFQAFLKIFEKLHDFEFINEKALTGWLARIVINQALMNRRKELKHVYVLSDENDAVYEDEFPEENSQERLMSLIHQLPDGYKTVFLLHVVDEYSHKEIAEELGISEGTSRSQFFKARNILKKQLKGNHEQFGT